MECRSPAALGKEEGGYFSGIVPGLQDGSHYRLRTDDGAFPDPASRFQPEGPHGPSEIVRSGFAWTDQAWRGRERHELVLYELHLGTFTPEGTWAAAERRLPDLARLGITAVEIMPIATFPGKFGWGYDGVALFAPCALYGRPDDARRFVDRAHALGLAVILDVVYNHLGPEGNYLGKFSPDYFSRGYANEWGQALNFDGPGNGPVREFFISNACYWIEEFHFDGLRFDATQQIFDASPRHVLAEMAEAMRAAAGERRLLLVAENESQLTQLVRSPAEGGYGLDAIWNDDFHHASRVAATGHREAYYGDYRGRGSEFVALARHGFLFQGQWNSWQRKRRGTPTRGLEPLNFVLCLQNHDQVANSLRGQRLHELTSPARLRALTAMWLLFPGIPMFFQGQEFAASAPFLYFADLGAGLQQVVAEGRAKFLRQFRSVAAAEAAAPLDAPHAEETFRKCGLDWEEREREPHARWLRLHRDLLRLRRQSGQVGQASPAGGTESKWRQAACGSQTPDAAVLAESAFLLRWLDRLLIVNLGADLRLDPAPEPLLAPEEGRGWKLLWSSEDPIYGGRGTPDLETTSNWLVPGDCTVLLTTDERRDLPAGKLSEKD